MYFTEFNNTKRILDGNKFNNWKFRNKHYIDIHDIKYI